MILIQGAEMETYSLEYIYVLFLEIIFTPQSSLINCYQNQISKERNRLKMLLPKSKPYVAIPNLLCSSPYISRCSIWTAEINSNVRSQTAL